MPPHNSCFITFRQRPLSLAFKNRQQTFSREVAARCR